MRPTCSEMLLGSVFYGFLAFCIIFFIAHSSIAYALKVFVMTSDAMFLMQVFVFYSTPNDNETPENITNQHCET